jgi:WD40 repeat protein
MRLLAKKPADRPASAQEVVAALAAIENEQTALTPASARAAKRPSQKTVTGTSRRPLLVGAGVLLAVVLAAGIYVLTRPADQGSSPGTGLDPTKDQGTKQDPLPVIRAGAPLSPMALVARPPTIPGVDSWSIETYAHRGPIGVIACNKDSTLLASGGDDGTVRLWSPGDKQLLRILLGHADRITSLAWSPDGNTLASGSADGAVRIWNPHTGKSLHALTRHTGPIRSLAWSPDGNTLASGGADKAVMLWDAGSGELRRPFDVHKEEVVDVVWLSDQLVVSTGQRGKVRRLLWAWEASSGKALHSHEVSYPVLSWSANPRVLACKSGDSAVTFWDPATNQTRSLALKGQQGAIACLALSPDGKLLATGGLTAVQLWDAATGQLLATTEKQADVIWVSFSPDGQTFASGNKYGREPVFWKTVVARQANPIKPLRVLPQEINAGVMGGSWSPDGRYLLALNDAGTAQLWDAAAGKTVQLLPMHWAGNDVAWAPDGKRLVISNRRQKNTLWIRDTDTGTLIRALAAVPHGGHLVDWSSTDKLATASNVGDTVTTWDASTGQLGQALTGHRSPVSAAIWSPNGQVLATNGTFAFDQVILFPATGGEGLALPPPGALDQALAWSPDSLLLAAGGPGMRIWNAGTGKPLPLNLMGLKGRIHAVAWSPNGQVLAGGDAQGTIALWNAGNGAALQQIKAHDGPIHTLAWLADSKTLASLGEKDSTASFWQIGANKAPQIIRGLPGKGRFSPDRRFLLSRFDPTRVQLWDMETGRLQGSYLHLDGEPVQHLAVSAEGHYRISAQDWRHVVYVVRTQAGQEILTPEVMEKKYLWKNDPKKVRLLSK